MRKNLLIRLLAVMMAAVMLLAMAAGCNRGSGDEDDDGDGMENNGTATGGPTGGAAYETPEYVYVAESIRLPAEAGDAWNFVFNSKEGKLIFASNYYDYDEETFTNYYGYTLYSINIDGTGLTKLENNALPVDVPEGANGGVGINALKLDEDGNIWVCERYDFYITNFPDGFDPERDMWQEEYYQQLGSGSILRKLDSTGAELLSIDLDPIASQVDYFYLNTFGIDGDGNIYLVVDDWERGGRTIYVLGSDGSKLFELSTESWFNSFIPMPDGSLAFTEESSNAMGWTRVLRSIDVAARGLGKAEEIPQEAWNIYPGSGEYDIIYDQGDTIYGYTIGAEEPVKLLNWTDSDIISNNNENITMLPDGRIFCTSRTWNNRTGESVTEILLLTKTPYSELPEKTIITLAAMDTWNIRDAVVGFNRASSDYRIQIIDYSQYNTEDDWNAGLTRLTTDITAGNAPDIISLSYQLSGKYNEYARKGLFADLYPFIDSDPELKRSDFVEAPFKAAEVDGGLYQAFATFSVSTIVGNPSVVGSGIGWNADEFSAVLDAHPEADMPLGQWLTKSSFLQTAIAYSIDDYIDWTNGTANFDTPEFIKLLEYTSALPDEPNWDNIGMNWEDYYVSEDDAIPAGRQIMAQTNIGDIYWYMYYKALFGGEVAFKGFPNESRNGNSFSISDGLAITANSANKEAAWSFVRTILTEDHQIGQMWYRGGLPTHKAAFDDAVEEALNMREGSYGINSIMIDVPQQEDIDAIMSLINSTEGLSSWSLDDEIWNIISESVSDYYRGAVSAQDAARTIQSRLSIYVSERS